MWNGELSSCLGTLIAYYEIALRNRVHHAMSAFSSRGGSSSFHWYDRIWSQLKTETQRSINKVRQVRGPGGTFVLRSPATSPDELVSRLTFGFWPAILRTIDRRYTSQILPAVFPHHPLTANPLNWNNTTKRKDALAYIYEINDIRNRIAHHEPLWKFPAIVDTSHSPPIVVLPESLSQADSIARFQRLLSKLEAGVTSLSTDLANDMRASSWKRELDFLLSDRGVNRYRSQCHVPVGNSITPADLHRKYSLIGKSNRPIRIGGRSRYGGIFTPN